MKYYFFLILFFLTFNFSFAQDSLYTNNNNEHKNGLEFQIGSLLSLTNFNGYTFSYRYRYSYNSGLRIGIYTNINKEDEDLTQQLDSIINNPPDYSHNYNFKISIQYLHSIMNYNNFSLIWGGGPFISYSKIESNSENLGSSYIYKYYDKEKTLSYGIDLILGVEYKLSENVILSGEYGLTISKSNSDIEMYQNNIYNNGTPNRINTVNGERHTFNTRGIGVNLGLSIFF